MRSSLILLAAILPACGADDSGGDPSCLDADTLDMLSQHAEKLRASAAFLAGHPGETEAIGFFEFPELSVERASVYAGPLIMVCSDPLVYDEYCEEDGLCSQIECTGDGAGWEMHFRLMDAAEGYETATVDTAWADGDTGITYVTAADAGMWSLTGSGRMDVDTAEMEETYPDLVEGATVTLTLTETSDGDHGGQLELDGEVIATPDATTGALVPAGDCR